VGRSFAFERRAEKKLLLAQLFIKKIRPLTIMFIVANLGPEQT
jgi:hypothetical protein